MVCAIHQPNFFPWLGYFNKILKSDKFIILDDVQFPKTGGGYPNRVAINIQGSSKWITAPIQRKSGVWNINETYFQENNWRDKIKKTLNQNYAKTKYIKEYKEFVFELIDFNENNLSIYNINNIIKLCKFIGINTNHIILSSSLEVKTTSTQRLIDLTKKVECDTYMSGGGADGYQNKELFKKAGLNFIYQNFKHPIYPQKNVKEFISGLSILDALFNVGKENVLELLKNANNE